MIQYFEENDEEYRHASIDLFLGAAVPRPGLGTDTVRTMVRHLIEDRGHRRPDDRPRRAQRTRDPLLREGGLQARRDPARVLARRRRRLSTGSSSISSRRARMAHRLRARLAPRLGQAGIVFQTKQDLLGEEDPPERTCPRRAEAGLLAGQQADGGFGVNVTRVDRRPLAARLARRARCSAGEPLRRCSRERPRLADRQGSPGPHPTIDGLARRCGSQEGKRCGLLPAQPGRRPARATARRIARQWRWPDGGWNCDKRRRVAARSTSRCRRCGACTSAICTTGEPAARRRQSGQPSSSSSTGSSGRSRRWSRFASRSSRCITRPYWHYDVLQALVVLARMGLAGDRAADASSFLESRRLADGRWRTGGRWWKPPGTKGSNVRSSTGAAPANEMVTLNALQVLHAAK